MKTQYHSGNTTNTYLRYKIETSQGALFAVRIENGQELMIAILDNKSAPKSVDINEAHYPFGHLLIKMSQNILNKIGWKSKGEVTRCKHCAIARGWQMNVEKKTNHAASKKVGER
jgi:hypothetical protein